MGQIRLTFREPVTGPATAEWYNSPSEDDKFDRFRRQEGYIMPGKDKAKINLSGKDNGNLRLNIHGNFRLGSIEVAERISVKALSFGIILGHFNWLRLILFMFLGASGFCLLEKERKQTKTETRHVSKKEKRCVYLDGIRILAAILVIIVHVNGVCHLCDISPWRPAACAWTKGAGIHKPLQLFYYSDPLVYFDPGRTQRLVSFRNESISAGDFAYPLVCTAVCCLILGD